MPLLGLSSRWRVGVVAGASTYPAYHYPRSAPTILPSPSFSLPPSLSLSPLHTQSHPGFFSRSSLHPSISWSVATLRYFDSRGLQPLSLPHRRQYGRPLHTGYITAALLNYARYFFEGESRVLPSLTLPPFFSFLLIYPPRLFLFFPLENSSLSFFTLWRRRSSTLGR